jgi:hypothetical protein
MSAPMKAFVGSSRVYGGELIDTGVNHDARLRDPLPHEDTAANRSRSSVGDRHCFGSGCRGARSRFRHEQFLLAALSLAGPAPGMGDAGFSGQPCRLCLTARLRLTDMPDPLVI